MTMSGLCLVRGIALAITIQRSAATTERRKREREEASTSFLIALANTIQRSGNQPDRHRIKRMRFTTPPGPPTPGFPQFPDPTEQKRKRKREGSNNKAERRTKIPKRNCSRKERYFSCCKHRVMEWYTRDGHPYHRLLIVLPLPVAPKFPTNLTIEICQNESIEETFVNLYQAWTSCPLSEKEFRANIYWKVRQVSIPFAVTVETKGYRSWQDLYSRNELRFETDGVIRLDELQYTPDVDKLIEDFGNFI